MADNLLSLVSQFITPDAVAKIAEGTATDPATIQKLVGAAVPALMAGMANAASTAEGAKSLADAVSNQDPALLDNLKASFGAENQIEMAVNGSKMLGSVMGDKALSSLTATLSKFAGAESETTESVLGVLGPAVTGVLGQQDPSAWSDPNAIMATFAAQKDNIMAAMPAGLGALLGSAGMAGAMAAGASSMASAASGQMAASASSAAAQMAPRPAAPMSQPAPGQDGGVPTWVYILVAVAVVAALVYFFYPRPAAEKKAAELFAPQAAITALI